MNGPSPSGYAASGYVSINFVAAPRPSIWAMTLTGFAGLELARSPAQAQAHAGLNSRFEAQRVLNRSTPAPRAYCWSAARTRT